MSDTEDSNYTLRNESYDSDDSTVNSVPRIKSKLQQTERRTPSPPPNDFVANFQKCLDLFKIRPHSHRYSFDRRSHTKSHLRGQTSVRGADNNQRRYECCSLSDHKLEAGAGDMATEMGQSMNESKYECMECGRTYSKSQYVRDHFKTVHRKSKLNYSCRVCGKAFSWRVTALKHIKKSHPEKNTTHMIDILN